MASGSESKIDTKLFVSTADSVGNVAKELTTLFQDYAKAAQTLRSNWQGDSSEDIKGVADQVQKSGAELLRKLNSYRSTLNEIAGIYDKTEKNVQETSKSLKFENTFR